MKKLLKPSSATRSLPPASLRFGTRTAASILCLLLGATSGSRAQDQGDIVGEVLYSVSGDNPRDWFGRQVASLPDVDGDGVDDFLAGSRADGPVDAKIEQGYIRVVSGREGRVLYTLRRAFLHQFWNEVLLGLPDMNGDDCGDFLVSVYPEQQNAIRTVELVLRSGKDGAVLNRNSVQGWPDSSHWMPFDAGDLDGDGLPEYGFGGQLDIDTSTDRRTEFIFRGSDRLPWFSTTIDDSGTADTHKAFFPDIGDVDGDGERDVALTTGDFDNGYTLKVVRGFPMGRLGEWQLETIWSRHFDRSDKYGCAGDVTNDGIKEFWYEDYGECCTALSRRVMISGADGRTLWSSAWSTGSLRTSAYAVVRIGDVDRDGYPDLVGYRGRRVGMDGVGLFSGCDGSILAEIESPIPDDWFGAWLCAVDDLNGDGILEVAVSATGENDMPNYLQYISRVDVVSFRRTGDPPLSPSSEFKVVRQGGAVALSWKAGLEDAALESSSDLKSWEPVEDVVFENFYVVPVSDDAHRYYRLRFTP